MKSNAKTRILKRLEDKRKGTERGPVTLSFNLGLYKRFKAACEASDATASQVIETFMEEFLEK